MSSIFFYLSQLTGRQGRLRSRAAVANASGGGLLGSRGSFILAGGGGDGGGSLPAGAAGAVGAAGVVGAWSNTAGAGAGAAAGAPGLFGRLVPAGGFVVVVAVERLSVLGERLAPPCRGIS